MSYYKLKQETLFICCYVFDLILFKKGEELSSSQKELGKRLTHYALTALVLSIKFYEISQPSIFAIFEDISEREYVLLEEEVLVLLDF